MQSTSPEVCPPWNREQAEAKISLVEDSLVKLGPVLRRFTPHHVHWLQGGAPLIFRLIPEFFQYAPLFDSLFNRTAEAFFRWQGLPGKVSDIVYFPEEGVFRGRKALRFREIDFKVPIKRIYLLTGGETYLADSYFVMNSSRVDGSESIYQLFTNGPRNYEYLVYKEGQDLVNTMLSVRI